jgi:hypothetical protein
MVALETEISPAMQREQANFDQFVVNMEQEARTHIRRFFAKKKFHCGGPIDQKQLLSQANVDLVLSTPFCEGIDIFYKITKHDMPPKDYDGSLEWPVYQLTELRKLVGVELIPKVFQMGVILLYLKFCVGKAIPQVQRNITHLTKWETT